ncbi:hypothetical protein P4203_02495 [Pseudomonas aeruginosa]|nr:hypothetical protein [Pseudomonas aeruginosa]
MAPLDSTSPAGPLQDQSLARYSERQLAVANTWATHFSLVGTARTKFIRHYLRSTSTTRCWCITVAADNGVRYTIMRAGPLLQVFDGQLIGAWECKPAHRIPASTPSPAGALKLLQRLQKFDDAVAVLSSYTRRAHDLATQMARDDLGLQHRLVYPSHSNKRYYAPRRQFYLKQIGAVLRTFRQAVDQNLLFAIRSVRCLSPQLYNWLAQGDQRRRLQMLKAQPILTPLLVDCEEGVWPHTTTNDNGESIRHFLPCPFSLLDSERPQATTMPCDWYLDMGRILGQVADEGISVINFFAWLFRRRGPRFDFLVTSVLAVREELSSIANGKADIRDGMLSYWQHRLVTGGRSLALNGQHSMQPTMRSLGRFTTPSLTTTGSSTAARRIGRIRHGLQSLHG